MEDRKETEEKFYSGEYKSCGCPVEDECDHIISNFQKYCKHNPDAVECRIFDL